MSGTEGRRKERGPDRKDGEARDAYLARFWTVDGRMVRHGQGERFVVDAP